MNVFDIIGPVMIGPSSSHTAGAVRIGKTAALLMEHPVVEADILLHGSFAKTYKGHGTDKALVGGILKMNPEDVRIRNSLDIARRKGIKIQFHTGELDNAHPNTAVVTLKDDHGNVLSVQGASIGGGNIIINHINGMEVYFTGQHPTLIILHRDGPGTIAQVTSHVAGSLINICNIRLNRQEKGGMAVMTIEMDSEPDKSVNAGIRCMPFVSNSILLKL